MILRFFVFVQRDKQHVSDSDKLQLITYRNREYCLQYFFEALIKVCGKETYI